MATYLNNAYAVILVVLGLGFVIFIHELGHFLMAKWAGVKVEMFSIGFGPTLVSWRKGFGFRLGSSAKDYHGLAGAEGGEDLQSRYGETEYSIRALPLGGFVGMLGEDPGDDASKTTDPRAFRNKPVGARMGIISAGVIMNLIFGLICATWMHTRGGREVPAVVGAVVAGQPAYQAGIRPGDEIVAIDGRGDIAYQNLLQAVLLSGAGHQVKFDIKRPGQADLVRLEIEPKRAANAQTPTIGILSAQSLDLLPTPPKGADADDEPKTRDRVLAASAKGAPIQTVSDIRALNALLARDRDKTVHLVAERRSLEESEKTPKSTVEIDVPPKPFVDLGIRMTMGSVVAIRPDSPATKAGFRLGDRIVSVDDRTDFDPMRLPDLIYDRARKETKIEVLRAEEGKDAATVTLTAVPDATPPWTEPTEAVEPQEIPGLGLAVSVLPKVAEVVPNSPAAKAKVAPGDVVKAVRFLEPKAGWTSQKRKIEELYAGRRKAVALDGKEASWPWVFDEMQDFDGQVQLDLGDKGTVVLTPEPVAGWFVPSHGLRFGPLTRPVPPQPLGVALQRGWRDTTEMALSIFSFFRNLIQQRLGSDTFGGPVKITEIAFTTAKGGGLGAFIPFLGLLSINLAVINFMPIPPLDGGQMVFLIAEKVRGRPLPENAVFYPMAVGVVFIVILFVGVFLKDIISLF